MQKKQGFTLFELVVVFIIIGILSVLVVPSFLDFQRAANLNDSLQTLETSFGTSFSASRSYSRVFGVRANADATQFFTFSCDYLDVIPFVCMHEKLEKHEFQPNVKIEKSFEIRFFPPHGDIDPDSFAGETLELEIKNNTEESKKIKIYKASGFIEQVVPTS